MSLKGFYKGVVITITPDRRITDAAQLMRDHRIGDLVVVERQDGKMVPKGMITDRDLVTGALADKAEKLQTLTVQDLMSRNPVSVCEDDGLFEAIQKMRAAGISRVPVTSAQGELIGVLSSKDIFHLLSQELSSLADISDHRKPAAQESAKRMVTEEQGVKPQQPLL